jgi:hypothetical protein
MRFFHFYIHAGGVKIALEKFDYIRTQFRLNATEHQVIKKLEKEVLNELGHKTKITENVKLTVGEALKRHAEKLISKLNVICSRNSKTS